MKILVVGGGGREHAIVWKLAQSPDAEKIYCAPGNFGISKIAECVDIKVNEFDKLISFAKEKEIDLTVIGPDDPLVDGIVDAFEKEGLRVFGPRSNAAIIEGSKVFSKELMKKYNIPTAAYEVFDDSKAALQYIKEQNTYPAVIKAEGLALGKGVIIAQNYEEAADAISDIMEKKVFGDSGNRVVIEEFLTGQEVSILSFTDGKTIVPMVTAQDHKRAYDNDMGLNTGGMGTFSPSRTFTDEMAKYTYENILVPTMNALNSEGRTFKGIIFFGLMMTPKGVKVIEYNARFGDPETQVVLPRLKTDLLKIFNAVVDEKLGDVNVEWADNAAVCVICASGGYPQKYETGFEISGIDVAESKDGVTVFHAGTKGADGKCVTGGGRVLGVTAVEENLDKAIAKAYDAVGDINFNNMHYRKDIGVK